MVNLEKAIWRDSKFIYQLYCKLISKEFTISQNFINFSSHNMWYKNFLKSKNYFFIIKLQNQKVGYLRYERKLDKFEISIAIIEKYQNKGLGKQAFHLSKGKIKARPIISRIIKENKRSIKFFKSINFKKHYETKKYIVLLYRS